ncbi:ABC transporter family substrate-binding protein [Gordonia sp. (in: high G+C Gram-positive bacteria)]|uniref:ABC transporter family substrate-binding protein n=1 Tax=Gordonia sp. (in: high G+C Gram-positive bacteria) TaxID=84139 RepID=UPI00262B0CCD|nr:ABC transporter family substrate-binding protein [Gordonia sp. (in: high G+C Gram-positive bacteria)]HMS73610.1 ABC transporter family substrate-binding protein [Gordonia sp. (in: high G+C Gram-positive bacteria)]
MRERRKVVLPALAAALLLVGGCSADPPPPVRETAPPATPVPYPDDKTIYIATGSIGTGFNPHLRTDQGVVTTAIAATTLPSPFAPVDSPTGVRWVLQTDFVTSAEVTKTEPFTVTYRIHKNAQWSDGLPVTGDDFSYLWQQMSRRPGAVAPAGYRLIDSVATSSGGKTVDVRFAAAYPAWRELFTNLLPSHVLRGTPSGFETGMDSGMPVSAGPFLIRSIDQTRDEVRLIRNDRYWARPSVLDQIVLRRAGTVPQMVGSVRARDSAIVNFPSGPSTQAELSAVPGTSTRRDPVPRALTVTANTRTPAMRELSVRTAILGAIDRQLVTFAGAGDEVVTRFANTVYAPTDAGYTPADRPRLDNARIESLLVGAGFERGPVVTAESDSESGEEPAPESSGASGSSESRPPASGQPSEPAPRTPTTGPVTTDPVRPTARTPVPSSAGAPSSGISEPSSGTAGAPESAGAERDDSEMASVPVGVAPFQKDGRDLTIRVGAVSGDPRSASAAATIVDQLRAIGIRAGTRLLAGNELYGTALTNSEVDLVVGWTAVGVPPAVAFASQVDCEAPKAGSAPASASKPATPSDSVTPSPASGRPAVTSSVSSSSVSPTGPVPDAADSGYIGNISGLCDEDLIRLARAVLSADDPAPLLEEAEPLLAEQSVYLPIYQELSLVGVTDQVTGVPLSGPIQVGIFGDADVWDQK